MSDEVAVHTADVPTAPADRSGTDAMQAPARTGAPPAVPPRRPVDDLVEFVLTQTGSPVDRWAVAATLESRGLRDVDAQRLYGEADIFGLASRVHAQCRDVLASADREPVRPSALRWYRRTGRFLTFYVRGSFTGLPILVQVLAVVLLGSSLWSSPRFDNTQASVVAIATLLSFLVTGGFVQAGGRLGLYYLEQQSYLLARRICLQIVLLGAAAVVLVGVGAALANVVGNWMPGPLVLVAAAYYLLLSLLWLLLGVLYAMQLRLAILACFVVGITVVVLVQALTSTSVETAHWLGLSAADITAAVWSWRALGRRVRAAGASARLARLPRRALLVHAAAPYFRYGVLYFAFLFLDRTTSWSAGDDPLPLWFDTPYEIGLDIALLVLVLTLPQLEYTVHEFSASIGAVQETYRGEQAQEHNRHFVRFYLRQLALLAVLVVVSASVLSAGLVALADAEAVAVDTTDPITVAVFAWGVVAYALLVLSLLNGVFLFSLSRPRLVVPALFLALVVNAAVGWYLSRSIDYWYGVVGLAAGALVFAVLTTVAALRVLRRLDYYYYSAF